jgi:hypothetical protein
MAAPGGISPAEILEFHCRVVEARNLKNLQMFGRCVGRRTVLNVKDSVGFQKSRFLLHTVGPHAPRLLSGCSMDPYVIARINTNEARSQICKDGHTTPAFGWKCMLNGTVNDVAYINVVNKTGAYRLALAFTVDIFRSADSFPFDAQLRCPPSLTISCGADGDLLDRLPVVMQAACRPTTWSAPPRYPWAGSWRGVCLTSGFR